LEVGKVHTIFPFCVIIRVPTLLLRKNSKTFFRTFQSPQNVFTRMLYTAPALLNQDPTLSFPGLSRTNVSFQHFSGSGNFRKINQGLSKIFQEAWEC